MKHFLKYIFFNEFHVAIILFPHQTRHICIREKLTFRTNTRSFKPPKYSHRDSFHMFNRFGDRINKFCITSPRDREYSLFKVHAQQALLLLL